MTNIRKRLCLFFMLFAYVQTFSQSMRDEMRQEVPGISDPVTFETFSVWTSDSIAARVQILYRINGDFLFFSKNANAVKEEYIAQAEVVAEILDTLNNTVAREIQPVQIFRSSLPTETDKPNDIQGSLSFTLKSGTYHVVFEAKDAESGKSVTTHENKITIQRLKKDSISISAPLLVERLRNDSLALSHPVFIPINRGESIAFGTAPAHTLQLLTSDSLANFKLQWNIIGHSNNDRNEEQRWNDSVYFWFDGVPQITNTKNEIRYTIIDSSTSNKIVTFQFPSREFRKAIIGFY